MDLNKLKVGDIDDGSLEGAYCPECNPEEDGDGGIIEVDMEEPFKYYHYFCNAGCGFKVYIRIQHVIEAIEGGCDHTTTDMSGACTHCGKSAATQLNDRGHLEYEDCPFCHCERIKGELCHNGCKPAAFN